jgi:hypothetical protein
MLKGHFRSNHYCQSQLFLKGDDVAIDSGTGTQGLTHAAYICSSVAFDNEDAAIEQADSAANSYDPAPVSCLPEPSEIQNGGVPVPI